MLIYAKKMSGKNAKQVCFFSCSYERKRTG